MYRLFDQYLETDTTHVDSSNWDSQYMWKQVDGQYNENYEQYDFSDDYLETLDKAHEERTRELSFHEAVEKTKSSLEYELRQLEVLSTCSFCGTGFQEKNNIGRFLCKYHPSPLSPIPYANCCNRDRDGYGRGCVPCDHLASPEKTWERDALTKIPIFLIPEFNIPHNSIRKIVDNDIDTCKSYAEVLRVMPIQ